MKLILSKFDKRKKAIIIYAIPDQNISEEIQENLKLIYNKFNEKVEQEKQIFYDFGPYLSYLFQVPSAWFPDVKETLMITLYFDEHENSHLFKAPLENAIIRLTSIPNFTKIIYLNTPHIDNESFEILGKAIQILTDCFFEVNKLHATFNLGLAEIMVIGNKGGGKTSIVDYLIHNEYIPQPAPTLTPQIYNLVLNQMDFRVLDVCCKEHIKEVFEDHPIEPGKLPQAIVYVIDTTLNEKQHEASVSEFKNWFDFLSKHYPKSAFENLPILIIFNKIDLNISFEFNKYEKIYSPNQANLNLKYATVSAKTGMGLLDNFSWVLKRLKVTQKY